MRLITTYKVVYHDKESQRNVTVSKKIHQFSMGEVLVTFHSILKKYFSQLLKN